jgi:hypothetical protein
MKRPLAYGAVGAAGAALVVLTALGVAQRTPAPPRGTLELIQREHETVFKLIDHAPRQGEGRPPSPGDQFLIGGTLRDGSNAKVGKIDAVFTVMPRRWDVAQGGATFNLRDGAIVVEGQMDESGPTDDLAITGGTGRYAGARGTLRMTKRLRDTAHRFRFTP